jgi:glucose-1-phosphate cytidylyltransferase
MKAVILAGGLGTRISEETSVKPKPMVKIGGMPILWHILKIYSSYGINDFVICCGYKGYVIKEYFSNYFLHMSDVTINMKDNKMEVHQKHVEPWNITLVDTGESTQTGGRIKRVKDFIDDENFCLTYGDGLANINILKLIKQHKDSNCLATMTAVKPPGRFGSLSLDGNKIIKFIEKPEGDGGWINGGFFVLNRKIFDFIDDDSTVWEGEPLEILANMGQLQAYFHSGFWHPMDTLRDKIYLEKLWKNKKAPWKNWNE